MIASIIIYKRKNAAKAMLKSKKADAANMRKGRVNR
jgi:hypothetical protein